MDHLNYKKLEIRQDVLASSDLRNPSNFVHQKDYLGNTATKELQHIRKIFYEKVWFYCAANNIDVFFPKAPTCLYVGPEGWKTNVEAFQLRLDHINQDFDPTSKAAFCFRAFIDQVKSQSDNLYALGLYQLQIISEPKYCVNCEETHSKEIIRIRFCPLFNEQVGQAKGIFKDESIS